MNLLQKFTDFIKKENLFQQKDKLLVAVSGGVDSVVLCELCKQAGYDFVIAHCNFKLRGQESERDEQFVRELAKKYGVEIFVKEFETETIASEQKRGIQEVARGLRYAWFMELWTDLTRNEISRSSTSEAPLPGWHTSINNQRFYVTTAHHANDNIETFLMNLFKGTGVNGLRGIAAKSGIANYLVRPLLFAKKEELLSFANENNLPFVEDSSNASDKYTRNYFRNQLIPSVQKVFPQAEENLLNSIERFKDIETLYHESIDLHKKKLLEQKGQETHIPVLRLLKSKPLHTIVYEIIKDFGFTSHQTDEVLKLLNSESGKYIESSSYRIIKNRNWLIISPLNTVVAENILIEGHKKAIEYANGKLKFEKFSAELNIVNDNSVAMLDADEIKFPLLLRKWKQGDYFYPLGMKKKKKLSKFFIDQKLSLTEKENVWVLEANKKIIWVIGKRIDDRFKIKPSTKNILRITRC